MSYPGNSSLSTEIRERLLNTFEQTREAARHGNREEAILGCDFILRMDPLFDPARKLMDRLNQGAGPVDVSDLSLDQPTDAHAEPAVPAGIAGGEEDLWGGAEDALGTGPTESASLPALGAGTDGTDSLSPVLGEGLPGGVSLPGSLEEATQGLPSSLPAPAGAGLPDLGTSLPDLPPSLPGSPTPPAGAPVDPVGAATAPGPDSDQRIQALLNEGQAAFERSEYQAAIDAWSRIFLIDIDHSEATRRIDVARKLKAESERKVDEVFHEGITLLGAGRKEEARQAFERILEIQPNHLAAKEQLQHLETGVPAAKLPPVPPGANASLTPSDLNLGEAQGAYGDPAPGAVDGSTPLAFEDETADDVFQPTDFKAPPPPGGATGKPSRSFLLIGGPVLVLVLVGVWLLYSNWGSLFPNSNEGAPVVQAPAGPVAVDPITKATKLHHGGRTAMALEQLRRLPPGDPHYDQAQHLISLWTEGVVEEEEAGVEEEMAEEELPEDTDLPGMSEERMARRQRLLQRARKAFEEREYLAASRYFERAARFAALEGPTAKLYEETRNQLEPLATQIDLFEQRQWEMILRPLWEKLSEDPGNKDVARLLSNAYYNLGLQDLKKDNPIDATDNLREALEARPDDEFARRVYLFAQAYQETPTDLLYSIFVKQLQFRR